jgi:hypothetical protein
MGLGIIVAVGDAVVCCFVVAVRPSVVAVGSTWMDAVPWSGPTRNIRRARGVVVVEEQEVVGAASVTGRGRTRRQGGGGECGGAGGGEEWGATIPMMMTTSTTTTSPTRIT